MIGILDDSGLELGGEESDESESTEESSSELVENSCGSVIGGIPLPPKHVRCC